MENKKRAWIYCRIDAPEDAHGALKGQYRELMDYADQMGFEVVGSSEDVDGGRDYKQSELKRFTEAAEQGRVDILIVRDLSRIGRHVCEAMKFLNLLNRLEVDVYSPLEGRLKFTMQNILKEASIEK